MFDWNDLRHFLAVARHGSTIAAARNLNLSQSTVHRRLDELEKQVGRPIVVRQAAGYRLTDFGKEMLPHGHRAISVNPVARTVFDDVHCRSSCRAVRCQDGYAHPG